MRRSKTILFLTVFSLLALTTSACSQPGGGTDSPRNINIHEFNDMITSGEEYVVIDVRTPKEIAAGKVDGALEIDFLAGDFSEKVKDLEKDKTYLLYCRTGNRSGKAGRLMIEDGFENVYNLNGGFTEWAQTYRPD